LTEDDLIAWRAVDPSTRADDFGTLAGKCMVLLINQASFDLNLPLYLPLGLHMGHLSKRCVIEPNSVHRR
jgi:hypothetical protein